MATSFECEFADKVSKGIQAECPICLLVLKEPYQATCCGKSFCNRCIHQVKAANQACPMCNKGDFTIFPNLGLQQSLYDFKVYCTHKSKGCEWTGELRELDNHLNSDPPADKALQGCSYTLTKCPLGCAGCEKEVYRKDVKSHVNDKLLGHVMMQSTRINALEQQLQEYRKVNTQLEKSKELLHKRMTELETKVSELDVKNRELESEVRAQKLKEAEVLPKVPPNQPISNQQSVTHVIGTYKPRGAEFTMTDFEKYQMYNDTWHSSHFYTHPSGYKMCLRVDANGNGGGKGTHISVFVFVMRGEFDDQLKWPFHGIITIKLVNQEEDKDHVLKNVIFSRSIPQECCGRVTTEKQSNDAWGKPKFLSLAVLRRKYLKDDCIKLCIEKVELF